MPCTHVDVYLVEIFMRRNTTINTRASIDRTLCVYTTKFHGWQRWKELVLFERFSSSDFVYYFLCMLPVSLLEDKLLVVVSVFLFGS